jgi:hypothetical protein
VNIGEGRGGEGRGKVTSDPLRAFPDAVEAVAFIPSSIALRVRSRNSISDCNIETSLYRMGNEMK